MAKKPTDLATIDAAAKQFPAIANGAETLEIIRENMGGEEISPNDLVRIKMPAGGSTIWEVPMAEGSEGVKELEGIVVHITRRRAYWASTELSNDPPDCSSQDCRTGRGKPGGDCLTCPLAEFGTAKKRDGSEGRGVACTERKVIFLLRAGQTLPDIVDASPTSLKALRQWQLSLGATPYYSIVSGFSLKEEKNKDNDPYSVIVPRKVAALPADAVAGVRAYAQMMGELFNAAGVDRETVTPQDV